MVLLVLVGWVVVLDGDVKRAEVGGHTSGCTHRWQGEELLEPPETPRGCWAASLLLPGKGSLSYIRLPLPAIYSHAVLREDFYPVQSDYCTVVQFASRWRRKLCSWC